MKYEDLQVGRIYFFPNYSSEDNNELYRVMEKDSHKLLLSSPDRTMGRAISPTFYDSEMIGKVSPGLPTITDQDQEVIADLVLGYRTGTIIRSDIDKAWSVAGELGIVSKEELDSYDKAHNNTKYSIDSVETLLRFIEDRIPGDRKLPDYPYITLG